MNNYTPVQDLYRGIRREKPADQYATTDTASALYVNGEPLWVYLINKMLEKHYRKQGD